jgi:REP element-mobilizing transposase RayT
MTVPTPFRGYLNLTSKAKIYFVTFRLADSLPRELLPQLRAERQTIENAATVAVTVRADETRLLKLKAIIQKAERCLDGGFGSSFMQNPRIAKVVADALKFFDGQRYHLLAWCVMPNHVHVVFSPIADCNLQTILHSWKSFSAEQANRLLGRSGRFWQHEYFDHLIRNESSLSKIIDSVKRNPEKAGFRNGPWVGMS